MCKWGTYAKVELCELDLRNLNREQNKLRARKLGLSEKGELIDSCIAPLVQMLNDHEIKTVSSCCGHGKLDYSVIEIHPKYFKLTTFGFTKFYYRYLVRIFSYIIKKLVIYNRQFCLELKFPYKGVPRRSE